MVNDIVKNLFEGGVQSCATGVYFNIYFKVSLGVHGVDDLRTLDKCP